MVSLPSGDQTGLYFYIRPTGCDEVVRIRVDKRNEPSLMDDNKTYFVHKVAQGTDYKCNRSAELNLTLDSNRRILSKEITGGELVTEAEYEAWLASQITLETHS